MAGRKAARYSADQVALIRALLSRYRAEAGLSLAAVAAQVNDHLTMHGITTAGRCDASFLHHLEDPTEKFPGISEPIALALHDVLQFGELADGDDEAWFAATGALPLFDPVASAHADVLGRALLAQFLRVVGLPIYGQKWARARLHELRFRYRTALPLLEETLFGAAEQFGSWPTLLGIVHHDLAEAHIALGNLPKARLHCATAERIYRTQRDDRPDGEIESAVTLGMTRTIVQTLQIAVLAGESEDNCLRLYTDAVAMAKSISDAYGEAKAALLIGYLYQAEEDFANAAIYAARAREAAARIRVTDHLGDWLWLWRDGLFIGSQWMTLHALALTIDVEPDLGRKTVLLRRLTQALQTIWWARQIPPLYPFDAWRIEQSTRRRADMKDHMTQQIRQMEHLGLIQNLPYALISRGDFAAKREGSLEGAAQWYREARRVAAEQGFARLQRLAERRLTTLLAL
ncbi:MAG: hypothetical protein ACYDAR_21005 [Thermomicrobiales bacterium]